MLEAGDYQIKLQSNAHDILDSFNVNVLSPGIVWKDGCSWGC